MVFELVVVVVDVIILVFVEMEVVVETSRIFKLKTGSEWDENELQLDGLIFFGEVGTFLIVGVISLSGALFFIFNDDCDCDCNENIFEHFPVKGSMFSLLFSKSLNIVKDDFKDIFYILYLYLYI